MFSSRRWVTPITISICNIWLPGPRQTAAQTFSWHLCSLVQKLNFWPGILEAVADPDMENIEDVNRDVDPEVGYVDEVEYISVDIILDKSCSLGLNQSVHVHIKGAAYTFNWRVSVDADKALDSQHVIEIGQQKSHDRGTVAVESVELQ